MTKQTMIWQTLSMIIAGMVQRKEIPKTKKLFEDAVVSSAQKVIDYSSNDIRYVLNNYNVTEFAEIHKEIMLH